MPSASAGFTLRAGAERLELLEHDELLRAQVERPQRAPEAGHRLLAQPRQEQPVGHALRRFQLCSGHAYEVTFEHTVV